MARRVEAFDWASTPLGPRDQWPVELRSLVSMVLESHFPTALVWGPAYTTIYNDAFRPILGDKPEALGRSFTLANQTGSHLASAGRGCPTWAPKARKQ